MRGSEADSPPRRKGERGPHAPRKDLQDLRHLPRSALHSYRKKHAQPHGPRSRAEAVRRGAYPALAAFAPRRFWKWMSEYWRFRIGRRHPFQTYDGGDGDNGVYALRGGGSEIRIALAGDWGTGTDEAAEVAALIEAWRPHYSIHLGDLYYVGDPAEVGANFLGLANPGDQFAPCKWPLGSEGSFALNGNHEMYALGYGYFDHLPPKLGLRGAPRGQRASYFCLENDHWRIIGLDTAYDCLGAPLIERLFPPDCAPPRELVDWLRDVVKPMSDDPRGIVILSHHPYVSRFDHCYPEPARQLAEFLRQPVLWLWGHEHLLAIYREAAIDGGVTAFGRCIGHGGMPVDLPPKTPRNNFEVEFVDDRVYPNDEDLVVGFNGFARMTLRDDKLRLDYVDLRGACLFSETWTAGKDKLTRLEAQRG